MMNNKILVYVGFAFEHHLGTHGGYHHIAETGIYDKIIDCQDFFSAINRNPQNLVSRIKRSLFRRLIGLSCFPWFIFRMLYIGLCNKEVVFHIIYGENLYTPLFRLLPRGCKIVCTFHQPFEWFDNKRWHRYLAQIDKIILVSNKEVDMFRKVTHQDNVVYIPHGVCTDFYKPCHNIKKRKMILTVGNWLRDYKFADKVYKDFVSENPDWEIVIIANPESVVDIQKNERIRTLHDISDNDLLWYYCQCSVLFLPLKRFTANNSLLEAASCGCNIVISSDNPDNSYIPDSLLKIVPLDVKIALKAISEMSATSSNATLSDFIYNNYSWKNIGDYVREFLYGV